MKKSIETVSRTITFTFEGLDPVVFSAEKVSAENMDYAILHGFGARIGDNAALNAKDAPGGKVTEAMRRAAVVEMVDFYHDAANKDWNMKPSARKPVFNPHIQAIADKLGKSYDEAAAWYNEKLMAELAAM